MHMTPAPRRWTLAEFDRLPDDGARRELADGVLLVTPAPLPVHESLAVLLRQQLEPYVTLHGLGEVFTAPSAVRTSTSELQPDLMVRGMPLPVPARWEDMPTPLLVVEIMSAASRERDATHKRRVYLREGIAEYWLVNPSDRTVRIIRPDAIDTVVADVLTWHPVGATAPLALDVSALIARVLGSDDPGATSPR